MGYERLRITTAESEDYYRELDLIDYAVLKYPRITLYDAVFRTLDGTEKVVARRKRLRFGFDIDGLPIADYTTLFRMLTERAELYFETEYCEGAQAIAPYETTKNPLLGTTFFSRTTVATYTNQFDNIIYEVASGYPRFEAGKMGNGILLEAASTNYFYPSHGASGDTVLTAGGTAVIAWNSNITSNVDGQGGVIQMRGDTADGGSKSVSGLSDSNKYSCFVYVKGIGRAELALTNTYGGGVYSGIVDLSMDQWQQLKVENFSPDTSQTSVNYYVKVREDDSIVFISAMQLELNETCSSYIATTTAPVTRNMDQAYLSINLNYAAGSVGLWYKIPSMDTGTDYYLFSADTNFNAYIDNAATLTFKYCSSDTLTASLSAFSAGDMVHFGFSWDGSTAYLYVNGVLIDSQSSNVRPATNPGNFCLYSGAQPCNSVIDNLAVYNRFVDWASATAGNNYAGYNTNEGLRLMKLTQGRRFRIRNFNLSAELVNTDKFSGSFELVESSSDNENTIEVA